jgi:pyridoxal phosphate phosphatase PHOSPHO2
MTRLQKKHINSHGGLITGMDTVIMFDFDHTLIDCNSDPWVVNQLGATQLMDSLIKVLPWTSLMDRMMSELHQQGKTVSDIEQSLKTVPICLEMIRAIKSAHSLGCDLRIVSDANSFYIKTILENYDLLQYFSEIHTNPASVDNDGRLRIFPYHSYTVASHGCELCPPNMCKGAIVDGIQRCFPPESNKRFIYLGDGRGDFCPSLKLGSEDHVLARQEYPLWKLLGQNPDLVKAQVHSWSNAKDVEDCLCKLLMP